MVEKMGSSMINVGRKRRKMGKGENGVRPERL
jgi:hypothetical protein